MTANTFNTLGQQVSEAYVKLVYKSAPGEVIYIRMQLGQHALVSTDTGQLQVVTRPAICFLYNTLQFFHHMQSHPV